MNKKLVISIFIFSAIIRWVSYNYFLSPLISPADSEQYIAIAKNIVRGNGFSVDVSEPAFHRAPFLPYLLSILFWIFEDHWLSVASAVNIFISSIISVITYFTAMRIIDNNRLIFYSEKETIAIIASLFFAINPVSIFWSGFILTEPFFLFFFTLSILYLLKAMDGYDMRYFIICGVFMGLAALTRPVILGVIPFIILWIILKTRNETLGFRNMNILIIILFFILTILPWSIRNFLNSGEIIPITSEGHHNLIQGLTEDPETLKVIPLFTQGEEKDLRNSNGWEYMRLEKKRLIEYIFSHPGDILRLMFKKIFLFWSVVPEVERAELRSFFSIKIFMALWTLYSISIYILALYGFFSFKNKNDFMLIIFIMISFTIMHMFFLVVPEKRFRLPLEPYLVILASIGVSSLRKMFTGLIQSDCSL
jgi:4-amino-4-deoxy-L-arabinose transferase-like glycosyltransferase